MRGSVVARTFVAAMLVLAGAACSRGGLIEFTVSPNKDLTGFAFVATSNSSALTADVVAMVNGTSVTAIVPFGTDVSALVATFTSTGMSVTVGGTPQLSGVTPNDFSSTVTYRVVASDATTIDYAVTVTVALASGKELTQLEFLAADNPGTLSSDVIAAINGTTISATVPSGTDVTALVATFATTGVGVTIRGAVQASGATPNDFTNPVVYTVNANDGTSKSFMVTVTVAVPTANALTAFSFLSVNNGAALPADVIATITGTTITATVPFGTNVTGLVATFSTTGTSVAIGATPQVSGITVNDFSHPTDYTVTAADASTRTYTVTVLVAPSSAKDLTAFAFLSVINGDNLNADVVATITGTTIAATVPSGTTVTALVATFATTGASVTVDGNPQTGANPNDFTNPVVYTVTAADGSTKPYTVTVTIAQGSAKDITSYAFQSVNNTTLGADVAATISGTTITATVPFGTDVTNLVATFATTGAGVTVGITPVPQVSGATANDFTSPVVYTVMAADASVKSYTVTVNVAPGAAKDITAYAFLAVDNSGLSADVTATISGVTISATVPFGTNVTGLIATFATTGASVAVGATPQTSGVTPIDFSSPAIYAVTAGDGSLQLYMVTVTVAPAPSNDLTAFSFLSATNSALTRDLPATITGTSITAPIPAGVSVTNLVATFSTTGTGVTVAGVPQVSGVTANDFTLPVTYIVTAGDGSTQSYTVTLAVCGDGNLDPGEQCDDGNTIDGDGCSHLCKIERCGDGIVQLGLGEQCDDGNTVDGDGCSATCQVEPFSTIAPVEIDGGLPSCSTAVANASHKIAVDGSGVVYAVMACAGVPEIVVSLDRGQTYSAPFPLDPSSVTQIAVATGPTHIAYVSYILDTGQVLLRTTTDDGATWGDEVSLGTATNFTAGLSMASFNDDLYIGFAVDGGIDVVRNHADGTGSFDITQVTVSVAFFDLLYDVTTGTLAVCSDTPTFHVLTSADSGVSFGAEVDPPGQEFFSDWAIGNGNIFVSGTSGPDSQSIYIIPTANTATSSSVAGLPQVGAAQARAVAADSSGNAFATSQLDDGGVQLDRLAFGASTFDTPSRMLSPTGTSAIATPLPGASGAAVVYTDGAGVFATIQVY